jgi:poly(hydroxyalkanoate) depolymerase family esterase
MKQSVQPFVLVAICACGHSGAAPTVDAPPPQSADAIMPNVSVDAAALQPGLSATITNFGSNPGNLGFEIYVPDGTPANAPLVVAMHGCAGSADVFAGPSGWLQLADAYKFVVVLPSANTMTHCFSIEDPAQATRGQGQALSIKQMIDWTESHFSIDPARVFATGFSSGGEMTNVMLAAYPDVFVAGGAVAGIPYRCATDEVSFGTCTTLGGRDLTPQQWGDRARAANPGNWTWPRMAVWQGSRDEIVAPMNLNETMEQWTNLNGIDQTPTIEDEIDGYPHKVYMDANQVARVETVQITGMDHGLPVDPGTGPTQCGTVSLYTMSESVGVCASYHIARWFGLAP